MSKVYKFICVECKGEFEGHWKKRYCEPCRDIVFGRNCKQCGIRFIDQKHPDKLYCSEKCSGHGRTVTRYKKCIWCKSPFCVIGEIQKSRKVCYKCITEKSNNKNRDHLFTTIVCKHCGNKKEVRICKKKPLFCSKQCSAASRITKRKTRCTSCDKEYMSKSNNYNLCGDCRLIPGKKKNTKIKPKVICKSCGVIFDNDRNNKRRFCSLDCFHNSVRLRDKDKFGYGTGWRKLRLRILERDNHSCKNCNKQYEKKGRIHVHHIKPRKEYTSLFSLDKFGNNPSNLICLCNRCHKFAECGKIKRSYLRMLIRAV